MDVLLLSNGKIANNQYVMEYAAEAVVKQIKRTNAKNILVIPFAVITSPHDDRVAMVADSLKAFGLLECEVTGIHNAADPVKAVQQADCIIVSGGNTFVLNKTLHDLGLVGPLRKAILNDGTAYIGWSAGCNIANPTIRTTNDMPIVTSVILSSLNLVPFQTNAHYIDATIEGHFGESRDVRINEFLEVNQHEPVVGLAEGTWLEVQGNELSYHSANGKSLKVFNYGKTPMSFKRGESIQFLMDQSC